MTYMFPSIARRYDKNRIKKAAHSYDILQGCYNTLLLKILSLVSLSVSVLHLNKKHQDPMPKPKLLYGMSSETVVKKYRRQDPASTTPPSFP